MPKGTGAFFWLSASRMEASRGRRFGLKKWAVDEIFAEDAGDS